MLSVLFFYPNNKLSRLTSKKVRNEGKLDPAWKQEQYRPDDAKQQSATNATSWGEIWRKSLKFNAF